MFNGGVLEIILIKNRNSIKIFVFVIIVLFFYERFVYYNRLRDGERMYEYFKRE